MADKDNKPLAGFDIIADMLIGDKHTDKTNLTNDDKNTDFQDIDPDDLQKQMLDAPDDKQKGDDKKDNKTDDKKVLDTKDKKVDIKDDNKDDKIVDTKIKDDDKDDDDLEYESDISTFFGSELAKKLKLGVDEKDLKFNNVEEVIDLMSEIIEENSKPTYASEEVEKYDAFVKNGGDLREFYKEVFANKLDVNSVDVSNQYDQRAVVRENLINQGYKEDRIKKIIARYEEAETLKEEAEDALELVKEYNKKKADSLLEQQKNHAEMLQEQKQKFLTNVNSVIKTISNFRGFPISEKEKRDLLQYAFVPDEDGITPYQKAMRQDVYNVLESAYFAKNRDKIKPDDVKKDSGRTDAYKTLRDKIKAKGNKQQKDDDHKSSKSDGGSLGDFGKGIFFS